VRLRTHLSAAAPSPSQGGGGTPASSLLVTDSKSGFQVVEPLSLKINRRSAAHGQSVIRAGTGRRWRQDGRQRGPLTASPNTSADPGASRTSDGVLRREQPRRVQGHQDPSSGRGRFSDFERRGESRRGIKKQGVRGVRLPLLPSSLLLQCMRNNINRCMCEWLLGQWRFLKRSACTNTCTVRMHGNMQDVRFDGIGQKDGKGHVLIQRSGENNDEGFTCNTCNFKVFS
jgi:hypothetical protein